MIEKDKEGSLAQQFGKLGLSVGIAMIVGPALGGNVGKDRVELPIYIALGCITACVIIW